VTEAVERWLQAEDVGDEERRYLEGYLRHPERTAENAGVAGAVVATWEPWEGSAARSGGRVFRCVYNLSTAGVTLTVQ
jgi:hypothetical protein